MTGSIRFGEWVWDPNTLELRHGAHVATLEPRVARLLEYLVTHPGELLSHDRIIEAVWDGRIVSDEAVRRAVFNLRQALAVEGADSYIRTIHKKGYVGAFPPPVAVDRVLPDTPVIVPTPGTTPPEAVTATIVADSIDARPSPGPVPSRRLGLAGAVALIALMALVATVLARLDTLREQPEATQTGVAALAPATIAVLPFISLSEASDNQLLAAGLTEELFGSLERNHELRVSARSSAFQFEEKERDARSLGGRLGVRYVLEGDVSRNAEQVLVQARLVDSETGKQLWTKSYNRAQTEGLALQQDIALDVANSIQRILRRDVGNVAPSGRVANAEAQLELLRARQLLITRSVADAEQAIEHLQRALTLDPNYSLAYARLADAILIQAESTTGIAQARPVVAPLLEKALALDPELGEAYALRSRLTDDAAAAERDLRRSLELNPSYARGYELLANVQARSALQIPEAISTVDSAIALDPLTPGNYHAKAVLMMGLGKMQEAAELDRRALQLNPNYRAALMQLSHVYGVQGYFADAIGYGRRAVALDPRAVPLREQLIQMYLAVGDIEAAREADHPPTPLGRLAIPWAEGKLTELADSLYVGAHLPGFDLGNFMASHIALRQAVSDGNYDRAIALLSPRLLMDGALQPDVSGWGLYAYANLAQLLWLSGDIAAAARLEEQLEERMVAMESRFPPHRFIHEQVRATLLARAGRSDDACAALNYSYTPNPRPFWGVILDNPAFGGLADTACLQALRRRIDQYLATERERIDAMKREKAAAQPIPARKADSAGTAT